MDADQLDHALSLAKTRLDQTQMVAHLLEHRWKRLKGKEQQHEHAEAFANALRTARAQLQWIIDELTPPFNHP